MLPEDPQFDTPYAAAFQGAAGSFGEGAAEELLGGGARLLACRRLEDVFDAVRGGRARLGVVPIENRLAGSVHVCYDLLLERDLAIVGEHRVRVELALVVRPGTPFERVRQVLSHPALLAQCGELFRMHPLLEPVPVYDPALGVERVVASPLGDQAAIASRRAADVYGGEVIAERVEDGAESHTRFLLIARPTEARLAFDGDPEDFKTSLAFAAENRPGALCECLGHFADRGVTLTRIESRPLGLDDGGYHFYVDVVGRIDDERVAGALEALEASASRVRVLGCYRRHEVPSGDAGAASSSERTL
jgi:prephenate dehydratase